MACSDKQYLSLEQTLGKSCVIWATNFSQTAVSQNAVFRRFLEIHPVDLAGGAKNNYSKSMRICQCTRHVQEIYVWLPISCPKFRSCHPKSRGRWKSLESWKIHRIVFEHEAFVTWAWSCASVMWCEAPFRRIGVSRWPKAQVTVTSEIYTKWSVFLFLFKIWNIYQTSAYNL